MSELEVRLKAICPNILRTQVCGSNILVVIPTVTDAVEDMIFSIAGSRAVILTPDAYTEETG